jgi:hypothetical protein
MVGPVDSLTVGLGTDEPRAGSSRVESIRVRFEHLYGITFVLLATLPSTKHHVTVPESKLARSWSFSLHPEALLGAGSSLAYVAYLSSPPTISGLGGSCSQGLGEAM